MSKEARNSAYLWSELLVLFGAFWACLHFNSLWPIVLVLLAINVVQTIWGFWQRRASGSLSTPSKELRSNLLLFLASAFVGSTYIDVELGYDYFLYVSAAFLAGILYLLHAERVSKS